MPTDISAIQIWVNLLTTNSAAITEASTAAERQKRNPKTTEKLWLKYK